MTWRRRPRRPIRRQGRGDHEGYAVRGHPAQRAAAAQHARLCQVLDAGGHPGRSAIIACRRGRGGSGCREGVTPGWGLEDTTLRGQPAWYVTWYGPASERAARLAAYQATLEAAGWTALPVQRWPHGARLRWRLAWPAPADTQVSLLVQAPPPGVTSDQ